MAKHMISKAMNIKIVGILDKNEEGKYIVTVENKDVGLTEYDLDEILKEMLGTEISITSTDEII
jgi:hypothetical protein